MRSLKRTFTRGNGGKLAFVWVLGAGVLITLAANPLLAGVFSVACAILAVPITRDELKDDAVRRDLIEQVIGEHFATPGISDPELKDELSRTRRTLTEMAGRISRSEQRGRTDTPLESVFADATELASLQLEIGPAGGGSRQDRRLRAAQRAGARRVDAMGTRPRALGGRPPAARAAGPGRDVRRPTTSSGAGTSSRCSRNRRQHGRSSRPSAVSWKPCSCRDSRSNAIPWTSPRAEHAAQESHEAVATVAGRRGRPAPRRNTTERPVHPRRGDGGPGLTPGQRGREETRMAFRPGGQGVRSNWLALALGLGGGVLRRRGGRPVHRQPGRRPDRPTVPWPARPDPPPNAVAISIASSNTKEAWLHQAVDAFNAAAASDTALQVGGKPVYCDGPPGGRRRQERRLPLRHDGQRHASAAESSRPSSTRRRLVAEQARARVELQKGGDPIGAADSPIVARTPARRRDVAVAVRRAGLLAHAGPDCTGPASATWRSRPTAGDRPAPRMAPLQVRLRLLRRVELGHPRDHRDVRGRPRQVGRAHGRGHRPANGCGQFVTQIERAKVHSGKSDVWLLDQMTGGGPEYLDGVVTYKSNVIARNKSAGATLREPLVSVYPQDGTIVAGHPVRDPRRRAVDHRRAGPGGRRVPRLPSLEGAADEAPGARPATCRRQRPADVTHRPRAGRQPERESRRHPDARHARDRPDRRGVAPGPEARRDRDRVRQVGLDGR